ncbi:MAG TPA: hypothetical protein PLN28_03400 [Anaerolineaceae bacterium]|nr:hypothetical protein [Anaerolineaceae bacterium]
MDSSDGQVSNAQTLTTVTLASTVTTVGNAGGMQMPGRTGQPGGGPRH